MVDIKTNTMEERIIKSILSWENCLKRSGFRVHPNLPDRFFMPKAIKGIVPDIFATKGGYCVAVCIDDNANFCVSSIEYACLNDWLYMGVREFIISCPGEWPNVSYTKLYPT